MQKSPTILILSATHKILLKESGIKKPKEYLFIYLCIIERPFTILRLLFIRKCTDSNLFLDEFSK